MQIKLFEQQYLSEIGQLLNIRFAYAALEDGVAVAQTTLCKCRDFLIDTVYANHHPDLLPSYSIYGFRYDVEKNPLDLGRTRFILEFPDVKYLENLKKNLHVLHQIEDANFLDRTQMFEADGHPNYLVIEGDKLWMQSCLAINIYTLLVKLCSYPLDTDDLPKFFAEQKNVEGVFGEVPAEAQYVRRVGDKFFWFIMQNIATIVDLLEGGLVDGKEKFEGVSAIHNNSGIISAHRYIVLQSGALPKYYEQVKQLYNKWIGEQA
jgi:hypothetical protein